MEGAFVVFVLTLVGIVFLGLLIASLAWAYRDAEMRGKPGWLVVLVVLLMNWPFSLLLWLLFRPDVIAPK